MAFGRLGRQMCCISWSSNDWLISADSNSLGSTVTIWGIVYVYVRLKSDVYLNKQTKNNRQHSSAAWKKVKSRQVRKHWTVDTGNAPSSTFQQGGSWVISGESLLSIYFKLERAGVCFWNIPGRFPSSWTHWGRPTSLKLSSTDTKHSQQGPQGWLEDGADKNSCWGELWPQSSEVLWKQMVCVACSHSAIREGSSVCPFSQGEQPVSQARDRNPHTGPQASQAPCGPWSSTKLSMGPEWSL